MKPSVGRSTSRAQVKAPPSVGLFTPSCAALIPVARATLPPSRIATRMPLPATSVAAPKVAKMPIPTIIPAVKSVAVNGPSSRLRPPPRALLTTGSPGDAEGGAHSGLDHGTARHELLLYAGSRCGGAAAVVTEEPQASCHLCSQSSGRETVFDSAPFIS